MDVAVVGDAEPVAFVDRPEFAALGDGTLDERIARGAALTADTHERSAGVWQAVVEAAGSDEEVDGWRLELEQNRRVDVGRSIAVVLGREPEDEVVTLLWLLYGPETYLKLVVDFALPRAEYEALLVEASHRLVGMR